MKLSRNRLEQPGVRKASKRLLGLSRSQNFVILLEQPRRRAARDLVPVQPDGLEHRRIQREIQARRECDGPQHADRILDEPLLRVPDRADDAGAEVVHAVDVVDDRKRRDVVNQCVDSEVASEGVLSKTNVVVVQKSRPHAEDPAPDAPARFARLTPPAKRRDSITCAELDAPAESRR